MLCFQTDTNTTVQPAERKGFVFDLILIDSDFDLIGFDLNLIDFGFDCKQKSMLSQSKKCEDSSTNNSHIGTH